MSPQTNKFQALHSGERASFEPWPLALCEADGNAGCLRYARGRWDPQNWRVLERLVRVKPNRGVSFEDAKEARPIEVDPSTSTRLDVRVGPAFWDGLLANEPKKTCCCQVLVFGSELSLVAVNTCARSNRSFIVFELELEPDIPSQGNLCGLHQPNTGCHFGEHLLSPILRSPFIACFTPVRSR